MVKQYEGGSLKVRCAGDAWDLKEFGDGIAHLLISADHIV